MYVSVGVSLLFVLLVVCYSATLVTFSCLLLEM